ncbi:MAG: glycosyltransferase [Luteibaculaceae bacterium]
MNNIKPKILIFTEWFLPGFRAGGPITSLVNLIENTYSIYEIYIVCSAADLDGVPYTQVQTDAWIKQEHCHVFYTKKTPTLKFCLGILDMHPFSALYTNSMFSIGYTLMPVIAANHKKVRAIVAPRGMLAQSALNQKRLKKKAFLWFLKLTQILKSVYWHATSAKEYQDILTHFPNATGRLIEVGNFSRKPTAHLTTQKVSKPIIFSCVARVAAIKNIHLLVEAFQLANLPSAVLEIYGPNEDKQYMAYCLNLGGKALNKSIFFKGAVAPKELEQMLLKSHFFILPTQGENFGQAIAEALSKGIPVLIPNNTAFGNVEEQQAGFCLELEVAQIARKIKEAAELNNEAYATLCQSALEFYRAMAKPEIKIELFNQLFLGELQ